MVLIKFLCSIFCTVMCNVYTSTTFNVRTCMSAVYQVAAAGETEYNGSGFRSGRNITGSFNLTFTTPGTYHYISEDYGDIGGY